MSVTIRIVTVGKYARAVKLGKCPMFALVPKENIEQLKAGLREDFPDCRIEDGNKPERAALAKYIIMNKTNSR